MNRQQSLIIKLQIFLNGQSTELSAIKYASGHKECFYKIALPTALSDTQLCWIAKNGNDCKVIMGKPHAALTKAIFAAIQKQQQLPVIYKQQVANLRSA